VFQRGPSKSRPQADVVVQGLPPPGQGSSQELSHARIALDLTDRHWFLGAHLRLGRNVADGGLHDSLFA
jgi:hypothetical protein